MKIIAQQVKQAEFARTVWTATIPADTAQEEVLKPEYWAHIRTQFNTGDRIEVSPESGEWLLELHVRAVTPMGVVVHVLHQHLFDPPTPSSGKGDFELKYSPAGKWRVIRKADRVVVVEQLPTRQAAEAWVSENTKVDLV